MEIGCDQLVQSADQSERWEYSLASGEKIEYNTLRLIEEANTMTNAQPSTIMGDYYNDISTFCKEKREAMFITKDGRNDLAVMSMEMYEALSKQELYRLLEEGRAAAIAGRKRPWRDVMSDIRQKVNDGSI